MDRVRRLDRLLLAVRACFTYPLGEARATGYLYGDCDWPAPLAELGPALLEEFPAAYVVFQAYRDGTATCGWHSDAMAQQILSLGASRWFCLGDDSFVVAHGHVIDVPAGVAHCVPPDPDVRDERVSLVFRGAE